MNEMFVTVDVDLVQPGDELAGMPGRLVVDRILFNDGGDGRWLFVDADCRVIARRPLGSRVQVVRVVDDCPPHGIVRPLRLVGT